MADSISVNNLTVAGGPRDLSMTLTDARVHAFYDPYGPSSVRFFDALSGRVRCSGSVSINGLTANLSSPSDAFKSGMGGSEAVFDSLSLLNNLKIALPRMSRRLLSREIKRYAYFSAELPMRKKPAALSPLERIRFIILRSLIRRDKVILLSLPFGSLSDREKQELGTALRRCEANRRQVLYSTDCVADLVFATDMTGVWNGSRFYSGPVSDSLLMELKKFASNHEIYPVLKRETVPGGILIAARGIWTDKKPGISDIHLEIREGTIAGVLYSPGCGESALTDCLLARRKPDAGRVIWNIVDGRPSEQELLAKGVRFIPPSEALPVSVREGSVLDYVAVLETQNDYLWQGGKLRHQRVFAYAKHLIGLFGLECSPDTDVTDLSKNDLRILYVASQLNREGPVLIAFDLFEGMTRDQIRRAAALLQKERNQKHGVLLFARNITELESISDDISLMREGTLYQMLHA